MSTPPCDQHALDRVAEMFGLSLILLFGSRANGEPKPDSDLDIAVQGCQPDQLLDCADAIARLFPELEVDLVRLEEADPLFRQKIMQDGELLYGDPDWFCEYRAYAYRDFVDSQDLRELEDTLFRKKMTRIRERLQ